ncbi:MAG: beta-glucosidase-like glycosyl hydrolase/CubicO group peptidase (beta-lactamase class C family) [Flammeovirgaceae bacterium]|jgi:beta-N-acetylhexosaminidase
MSYLPRGIILFIIILILILTGMGFAPKPEVLKNRQETESAWVEQVFSKMSEEEKIGQLFMMAAYSNRDLAHQKHIESLITKYHIGGLIFMQGGPVKQAKLTNRYQSIAKIPLMISMDAEWGLGMRLRDSTISYPRQMTLGAIGDNKHIFAMGKEIARQCKRLGVQVNFAPVVDVNVNPANPVIGTRSFGEDKENVSEKGIAYMKGMQGNGVMANAKHFPGHGDTDADSHLTLPIINHDKARLDSVELYPFKRLIAEGVQSIMVAHLYIPAYDNTKNQATTLSPKVVNGLLKDSLGFKGLIFTDALEMKGVAKYYSSGEVDSKALLAGNDVLLFSESVEKGILAIKKSIENGKISWAEIDERVKKILRGKYWVGLNKIKPIKIESLYADLNSPKALLVKENLYGQAFTVVKNPDNLLPFKDLAGKKFASVVIGKGLGNTFQTYLSKYAPFTHHAIPQKSSAISVYQSILAKVKDEDIVVVGVMKMNNSRSKNYGIHSNTIEFIKRLSKETKVVVVPFGNAYSLKNFESATYLTCAYDGDEMMEKVAPQVLFGAISNQARLPVSASATIKVNTGFDVVNLKRLKYSLPESVGMNGAQLKRKIDKVVNYAMRISATPGCQVLVARKGQVIFEESYGYTSYSKARKIDNNTIYDVASLTKVTSTLQALMKLEGEGEFDLNKKVIDYLPEAKGTTKQNLVWKEILTHQAGLWSYIPHFSYLMTPNGSTYKKGYFSFQKSEEYPIEIKPSLYAHKAIPDSVKKWTYEQRMRPRRNLYRSYTYRYSDMGFYLLMWAIENKVNMKLNDYVEREFYSPLGVSTMTYLPLQKFPKSRIAPTEYDTDYREALVQGYVHDPGAALIGGVGGHAGIFSNANDIAILAQMNLQDGFYGGKQYLKPNVVSRFNTTPYSYSNGNRRGIGWDKPVRSGHGGATSKYASRKTFGHTGFTGTAVWIDPKYDLVYIFLSNRINPYARNTVLIKEDIREKINDAIYESMGITEPR